MPLQIPMTSANTQRLIPSRRDWFNRIGGGFAGLVANWMFSAEAHSSDLTKTKNDWRGGLHHPARVRRIIQLFMTGGASPMDTFDYKPELARLHGKSIGPKEKPEGFTAAPGAIMKSPFSFKQHGESGRWVSSVFPHQAKLVDNMTFLMAMRSKTNVHGPATYMMNSGFLLPGFPCMGAWLTYALGNISDELPAFVVLPDAKGLPYNQKGPFSSGFLPGHTQGTVIATDQINADHGIPIRDLRPNASYAFATEDAQRDGFDLLKKLNQRHALKREPLNAALDARIRSYELAAKMQLAAPEAFDLTRESSSTFRDYGLNDKVTEDFGRRCLLARRLIERGTRFVQVWSGPQGAVKNWDNHGSIPKELPPIAQSADQPTAALLRDLKSRGLLEDTLLVWTTEFGRTPFAQGGDGRDHNGGSFVTWMSGAGVRPGLSYGASDELGYQAAEGVTYCYDFHATILHLMGIDHRKLVFRHNGIDRRLTDVHGHVVHDVLS